MLRYLLVFSILVAAGGCSTEMPAAVEGLEQSEALRIELTPRALSYDFHSSQQLVHELPATSGSVRPAAVGCASQRGRAVWRP